MQAERPDFIALPTGRFEWERIVRRLIVKPPSIKMVGLLMATYANKDGSSVRPGQARLAAVMGASISTVDRGQRELERLGFLELVRRGHSLGRGSQRGYASEYRLTLPSDLIERIPMLDPDEKHPAPVTGDSDKHPAPMTGEYTETHVTGEEIPVTGEETHVMGAEIPVTHDGPPLHDHYNDQNKKHQSSKDTVPSPGEDGWNLTADEFEKKATWLNPAAWDSWPNREAS
ncbi:helix-turn-helix domain-containing protein [Arthrobacter sp. MDT3-44]